MSDEYPNNDATQPFKRSSDETQPIQPGDGLTQPVTPVQKETEEIPTSPLKTPLDPERTPVQEKASKPKRKGRGWLIFAGILIILIGGALGSYLGYNSGIQSRIDQQKNQVATTAATQFQLGLDDLNAKRYELARTRFEYVIKLDPNFPGVQEKLTQTLVEMSATAVPPTSTPTPTLTPTPDMRGEQDLFNQIQQNLVDKNWDAAIQACETLRTKNLSYHTVDVDGMYYIALRYRGVDRILRVGDLEGGMYDLALVQRFGPLDRDADSYRLYARYYAVGASFWEVDWEKAMTYFGQVAPYLPMLRDSSAIAAIDRYRQAALNYAAQVAKDDACKAEKIFSSILTNNYKNATAEPLATQAYNECHPATETPTPTKVVTGTATITPTRQASGTVTQAAKTATPGVATTAAPAATTAVPAATTAVPAATTAVPAATTAVPAATTAVPAATTAVPPAKTNTPVPPTAKP